MDHFVWFDPHEARSRAEAAETKLRGVHFQIENARLQGQEDILQKIVEGEKSLFWREVQFALAKIASRMAEEVIFPQVRANYAEAKTRQRIIERELEALNYQALKPMMCAPSPVGLQAYMAPANSQGETGPRIVFTMPAFVFTQQLPPTREFR